MIKFPTKYGVGEVRGDQVAARECYITILEMDDHLQAINIKEPRTMAEPVERLEDILLDNTRLDRTTRISTLAGPTILQAFSTLLKENQDVFA